MFREPYVIIAVVVLAVAVLLIAGPSVLYALGLAWSKGYHRGKKQYVDRIIKENTCKEDR